MHVWEQKNELIEVQESDDDEIGMQTGSDCQTFAKEMDYMKGNTQFKKRESMVQDNAVQCRSNQKVKSGLYVMLQRDVERDRDIKVVFSKALDSDH